MHPMAGVMVLPIVFSVIVAALPSDATLTGFDDPNGDTHVICQDDPTQSYELYIPASVPASEPAPILYAFDPGGLRTPLRRTAGSSRLRTIRTTAHGLMFSRRRTLYSATRRSDSTCIRPAGSPAAFPEGPGLRWR